MAKNKKLKVILGCGVQAKEGWIGLDRGDYGQEIIRDLKKGLPFSDNSCDALVADQLLEHIQLDEDFIFIMNECLRVLKPKGTFEIWVPNYKSETAFKDPTHSRKFTIHTFTYLIPENKWEYGFDKRWKILINELDPTENHLHTVLMANKKWRKKRKRKDTKDNREFIADNLDLINNLINKDA